MANDKQIFLDVAKNYRLKAGLSLPGALLKASLVPARLFDTCIQNGDRVLDFGCGEGILSNLLATWFPKAHFVGIDLNREKINQAKACATKNLEFLEGDALNLTDQNANVVIFNDVLHHHTTKKQEELLTHAYNQLESNGLLVLKEVDRTDIFDRLLTTFFDRKLYPQDTLNFHTKNEWKELLEANGFKLLKVGKVKHPWIASRTFLVAKKAVPCTEYPLSDNTIPIFPKKIEQTRVFLTGATGFIGRHMAMKLLKEGLNGKRVELFLLARNPVRLEETLRKNATIIKGDLSELDGVKSWQLWDTIDFVFHFAAEVKIHGNKDVLYKTNVSGTESLLRLFNGKNIKRFLHASTMGAVDRLPVDSCEEPLTESTHPNPLTEYGRTKLASEEAVRKVSIPNTIVRIPWAYGNGMTLDTHLRNLFERVKKKSISTRIFFTGKVSTIAVEDLVRAFKLLAENPKAENEIFFISDGQPTSLGDIFNLMSLTLYGERIATWKIPGVLVGLAKKFRRFFPLVIQNLNSDVLTVNNKKITQLGFLPEVDLETGFLKFARSISHEELYVGKRVIVTGACSGVGLAVSRNLYARGFEIVAVDKNPTVLNELKETLGYETHAIDLSDKPQTSLLLKQIQSDIRLRAVINCAGVGARCITQNMTDEKIEEIINVNITSLAKTSKAAVLAFLQNGRGCLVNISSSAALQPMAYFSVYSASKAFVAFFTQALWCENVNNHSLTIVDLILSGTGTNFQKTAGVKVQAGEKLLNPAYVAYRISEVVEKGHRSMLNYVGSRGVLMSVLAHVLPRPTNVKLWAFLVKNAR